MRAMGYDAVLFDLDGTLVHTAPGILASFRHAFRQFGLAPDDAQLKRYLGPPLRDSFAGLLAPEGVEKAVDIYRAYYAVHGQDGCHVYAGVPEILARLRAAGYVLCVATSKARPVAERVLRGYGLLEAFDYLGGASLDASLDTKEAVIRHVLAQPCVQGRRAVMVGDRDNDMQGAAACGINALGARYGYAAAGELEAFAPLYLAPDVPGLEAWLLANKA